MIPLEFFLHESVRPQQCRISFLLSSVGEERPGAQRDLPKRRRRRVELGLVRNGKDHAVEFLDNFVERGLDLSDHGARFHVHPLVQQEDWPGKPPAIVAVVVQLATSCAAGDASPAQAIPVAFRGRQIGQERFGIEIQDGTRQSFHEVLFKACVWVTRIVRCCSRGLLDTLVPRLPNRRLGLAGSGLDLAPIVEENGRYGRKHRCCRSRRIFPLQNLDASFVFGTPKQHLASAFSVSRGGGGFEYGSKDGGLSRRRCSQQEADGVLAACAAVVFDLRFAKGQREVSESEFSSGDARGEDSPEVWLSVRSIDVFEFDPGGNPFDGR